MKRLAAILILLFAVPVLAQTPTTETQAALANAETVRVEAQPGVRYLTLAGTPKEHREETGKVLSYVLNALSRGRVIYHPVWVSDSLARISVISYAPENHEYAQWAAAWEKLGNEDPYFGLTTEVLVHGKPVVTRVAGGWTLPAGEKLKALTGSQVPIMRADWFIANAFQTPHYYRFAGVPDTEAAWLKTLGVDSKTIEALRANAGANLVISQVTFKPRRIVWSQGPLGGVYSTLDTATVDAARDPLRRPINAKGFEGFKYDATEWFAMAPNGLWRVALYDANGKQQQAVPPEIAADKSDPHAPTTEVIPALSCIRCHTEGGLRPFADDQTRLQSKALLGSYDPAIASRVAEFYDEPRLQRQMAFDRASYEAACQKACGLSSKELAEALGNVVRRFAYFPVTVEQAAIEVGLTADDFKRANVATADPVLLLLLHDGEVLRGQWESAYQEAVLAAEAFNQKGN